MKSKTTTASVNKLLRKLGIDATMYRAKEGYYYFINTEMNISSLYQYSIADDNPQDIVDWVLDNGGKYKSAYAKEV